MSATSEFEKGLKGLFEPIALECDTRLRAVINAQEELVLQIQTLDESTYFVLFLFC